MQTLPRVYSTPGDYYTPAVFYVHYTPTVHYTSQGHYTPCKLAVVLCLRTAAHNKLQSTHSRQWQSTLFASLWLICCRLGPEWCTSVKVTALVGVSMVAVLGREGDVCGAIQGGIVGSEQTASNLASSTGMSSMFSRCFMGTSLCLRGVEGGDMGGGTA